MRCFVAVYLDPELRDSIINLQKELAGLDTKLVEPGNLHFTLKFLGEVDEGIVNKVKQLVSEVARSYEPLTVGIKSIGVFPDEKFIRVVWIGCSGLTNLQADINAALASIFKKEKPEQKDAKRQSVPHLTIARVRSQTHRNKILKFLDANRNAEIGKMNVSNIKLKKSTVTNKGPIYEDIGVFELGK